MKTMRFVFAILLAAWATAGYAIDLTLDPGLDESGSIASIACSTDGDPTDPNCPIDNPLTGQDTFTLQILNPGFINAIADVQLVPDDNTLNFTSFHFQIQEPGPFAIATAGGFGVNTAPPNAPVTTGIYTIIVDWTLPGATPPGLTSATYTLHIFTSAEPNPQFVPEPGTLMLIGAAVLAIVLLRRRRVR